METKLSALNEIYDRFAQETASYRQHAACEKGCAYCCTDAGAIDVTTLEAWVIRDHFNSLPRPRQVAINKALAKDIKRREKKQTSPCPFLLKNQACAIYHIRPFSCRRIYSLKRCGPQQPPELHRQVMERAAETISELQRLDDTGYSGHLSFILQMLEAPKFLATYTAGEYKPEEVMVYGKTYGIVINRIVTGGR